MGMRARGGGWWMCGALGGGGRARGWEGGRGREVGRGGAELGWRGGGGLGLLGNGMLVSRIRTGVRCTHV